MVEMGQIKVLVQELGLKTSISAERNLDLLTLAGSGSPKFLGVVIFETILKKMGNLSQNELWARPVASKLSERWPLSFFHRRDTENGQKYCYFLPDPGVSGVRSMGPGLSNSVRHLCETLLM